MTGRSVAFVMPVAILILFAMLAAVGHSPARATEAQQDSCRVSAAKLRNVDAGAVGITGRATHREGYVEILFDVGSARGSCLFAPDGDLIDVRFSGGTQRWQGETGDSVSSQQHACAGEFARRYNLPLRMVSVTRVESRADGAQRMVVMAQDTHALCEANDFNAITAFEVLGG